MSFKSKPKTLADAKKIAFRLLKIRSYSEEELRQRLALKKFPHEIIGQTIDYLKRNRLIDDKQFTRQWISNRLAKPYGLRRIAFELKTKGIDGELLKKEIASARASFCEEAAAIELAKKRAKRYKNIDKEKLRQRIFQYLTYRGFDIETINQVVQKL